MSIRETLRSIVTFQNPPTLPAIASAESREAYAAVATVIPGSGRANWPMWDAETAREVYGRISLIYRCMNVISQSLGTATVRVYDESADNQTVPGHPLRQLMRRPNPRMGEASFWSHVGMRTAAAGFCVCEKEFNLAGDVIALWPLQSALLKAIPRRDSAHDWEYRIPGIPEPFRIQAEKVVVFRWADTPTGSPYGRGPLEACLREASIASDMLDFLKAMFEYGAVPTYGLIPNDNAATKTQEEADAFIEAFIRRRGGIRNSSKPIYLQGFKDIKRLGFDMDELAYTDLRDVTELGICTAFGVPPGLVGTRAGLERNTFSNAAEMRSSFYVETIVPLWTRFDDALTLDLLPDFEPAGSSRSLEFDLSRVTALQEDKKAKAEWLNPAVAGGWVSAHAWHRELGLPIPAGEDYYLRPATVAPVLESEPLTPPPAPAALSAGRGAPFALSAGGARAISPVERYARALSDRERITAVSSDRAPSIRGYFRAQADRLIPKALEGLSAALALDMFAGAWSDDLETIAAATFADWREPGWFNIEQRSRQRRATFAIAAVDWQDENERLRRILEQLYLLAGVTAFDALEVLHGLDAGIAFDLANPDVRAVIDSLAHRVVAINETTRQQIAEQVTQGLEAGERVEQIRDRLYGRYAEYYRGRSLAIARTESMVSYGEASALGFRKTGLVDRAQIFDNPEHTDEYGASDGLTCATRDGIVVSLESAMQHIYADHPNGSAVMAPVLIGDKA